MAFEYFDVPYRYNETCIKLIFQTPHMLFAFWDVSDNDEKMFIEKYGKQSYYNSKIYLEVTNLSNGKSFEIDVGPFAKNWYIHIDEPNCKYMVKLCRKVNNDILNITQSNSLQVPTDAPHFPANTTFNFVNIYTKQHAFTLSNKQAIEAINSVGSYSIDIEKGNGDKTCISYILKNPSSMQNVSSADRYINKEGKNG